MLDYIVTISLKKNHYKLELKVKYIINKDHSLYINMPSIKLIFVQDSIPKHNYMCQCGLHLNLEFKGFFQNYGFSINKMTRASNYQI